MSEEEKKAIEKITSIVKVHNDFMQGINEEKINEEEINAIDIVLNLIERQQKEIEELKQENENAKWYIHQMIVRINEDIEDYIDDDKEGNKDIIGEFRETKKIWQDVEKLLNGESKDNLFMDWRKYGEYE